MRSRLHSPPFAALALRVHLAKRLNGLSVTVALCWSQVNVVSASGHKQTYAVQKAMSAFPPIATAKADIRKTPCLLYPWKRTFAVQWRTSAKGHKRTSLHSSRPFPTNEIEIVQADEPLANSIASLIDASSLICFVPTFSFELLVFAGCWIVGRPLTTWCRYRLWRLHTMSCFIR
jgi:hypothetical protein